MIIKDRQRFSLDDLGRPQFWKSWSAVVLGAGFLAYSMLLFLAGSEFVRSKLPPEKKKFVEDARLTFQSHRYNPRISKPEKLEVAISQKDYDKIRMIRNRALDRGILLTGSDDYVSANLRHDGKTYRAKMRLKGDWTEHLEGTQWSYRVSLKGGETLFGMKEFSIQHPKTRNYIYEWLFHEALKEEDIIALRFDFIDVTINGEPMGIYALEEHFDKRLIENNRRREGPILKFDEDPLWIGRARGLPDAEPETAYYSSRVDVFQNKKTQSAPHLRRLYQQGVRLLEGFRSGELSPGQVFDLEKMARYYALCDLFGGQHATYYHNLRFYMNPVTSRLEPVGFDAAAGTPIKELLWDRHLRREDAYFQLDHSLFEDEAFRDHYFRELARMSDREYFVRFFLSVRDDLERQVNKIHKSYSGFRFTHTFLQHNFKFVQQALRPPRTAIVYFSEYQGGELKLRIANTQSLPLNVGDLYHNGIRRFTPVKPVVLDGKPGDRPLNYIQVRFRQTGGGEVALSHIREMELNMGVLYSSAEDLVPVSFTSNNKEGVEAPLLSTLPPTIDQFSFLGIDRDKKAVFVRPGRWTIDRPLILPEGFALRVLPGTTLDLTGGGNLIVYGPLLVTGARTSPVKIVSSDGTGQGIAVIGAEGKSLLDHVIFSGLSAPGIGGWQLSGAVTFYESDVLIRNAHFLDNNLGDDYLNVVRSSFRLEDSLFRNTRADALDADFTDGEIEAVSFDTTGNDAMDFSGSHIKAARIRIASAGDKGISVGEQSVVEVRDIEIDGCAIGFASKDRSELKAVDVSLRACGIGFIAFQKKPEFGPASIFVQGLQQENVDQPFLNETGSRMIVDGRRITPRRMK